MQKQMHKQIQRLFSSLLILIVVAQSTLTSFTLGVVPINYKANYEVQEDRDKIIQILVEIEAISGLGQSIDGQKFSSLKTHLQKVFPYFPQDYSFKITYEQCLYSIDGLVGGYSPDNVAPLRIFTQNCHRPLNKIISTINSKYTVKAQATVNPSQGSAPLTVTFDGRGSSDPSNETIASNNFFRYYRDVDGIDKIIGIGPVITHTFNREGSYVVHMTVRSTNKQTQGIFDGYTSLNVIVSPKAANISIFANGQKLQANGIVKIGVQEAQKGVIFDPTSTMPIGSREILRHNFSVISKDGFSFSRTSEGKPGIYNVPLPDKGEFTISLTVTDNQGNSVTEKYILIVSDPVALIKQSPIEGTTSTTYSFDGSPSYSVVSRLRLFTREAFSQNGEKIDTIQGKSFKIQFPQPGSYTIKLTIEDDQGRTDTSINQIIVESTTPLAQFSITPQKGVELPSEFILDASSSYDIDVENNFDSLSYERKFSDPNNTGVISEEGNKKLRITFNKIGIHKVTLTVKDNYGKISEITKDIKVDSTLRPELITSTIATIRGESIDFAIKSNKPIINYDRNFGDGTTRTIQSNKISHIYKKIGKYIVQVKVNGANGEYNSVNLMIFLGEKDSPIGAYMLYDTKQMIMSQNTTCPEIIDNVVVDQPAYTVDRYERFTIDVSQSVNSKGDRNNLSFFFQPKNDEIYKRNGFSHAFDELGCQFIDITVEDTLINKADKMRVRFNVFNALPTLNNIVLFFPQFGNEQGIGFQENNVKDIFNSAFDPLMVKVSAVGPVDRDGFISYFKRYYYYKDDPTRIIETKITPSDIPYTFFSLPRMPGEFMFGVMLYDNDDGKQSSESIIGNGPTVFFPPDVKRPDIPIVTLKADKTTVEVGDEIRFDVISKIISDRSDFTKERTILYDFDGDGERDLTTKADRVTYTYKKANEEGYIPRAAVLYRGYKGIAKGGSVVVKKGLKPNLLFDTYGKYVIFRDISIGEIEKKEVCLDTRQCLVNSEYMIKEGYAFDFEYPQYGTYLVGLDIEDKHANRAKKRRKIDINSGATYSGDFLNIPLHIMSIPSATYREDGSIEIFVGENLNNSILFNIIYDNKGLDGDCFIDRDINVDSSKNGQKDMDRDFSCNKLHLEAYEPSYESITSRIYYQQGDKMISKDFTISFLDFQIDLDQKTKQIYNLIKELSVSINTTNSENEFFKNMLINLSRSLIDRTDLQATLVGAQTYLNTNNVVLNDEESKKREEIYTALIDETIISSLGENEYEQAKIEILSILPHNLKVDIERLFFQFENTQGTETEGKSTEKIDQQQHRKIILQNIVNTIVTKISKSGDIQKEDEISQLDMEIVIMPNICKIANFYTIPTESCISETLKGITEEQPITVKSTGNKIIRIVFIILGIIIAAFIGLIVMFAIKAKKAEREKGGE